MIQLRFGETRNSRSNRELGGSVNITYMIGNGFDIALGLKTQYSDFMKHYCALDKHDNPVLARFQDVIRKDNCNLWSCAEEAFGKLDWSGFDGVNTVKTFHECLVDFENEFDAYLLKQWKRFSLPDGAKGLDASKQLLDRMLHLDRFMGSRFAQEYRQLALQQGIRVRIIVFNYTDIIEQIWDSISARQNSEFHVSDVIYDNKKMSVEIARPCFVHGVLSRSRHLFGVDRIDQVKDVTIRAECEKSGTLIKPYMDIDSGLGFDETANAFIESSDTIVTFGLSFGLSDRVWWERLYQHVLGRGRRLIICPYYNEKHAVMNFGDAAMIDKQNALGDIFSSLEGDANYKLDFSRNRIRNVRLLDDFEKDVGNGKKTRCDYFGLYELGKVTVKDD